MRWTSTIALALLLAGPVRGQPVGTCSPSLADAYLDIGNVRARILNNGNLFYRGAPHVYNVPKGSPSNAVFAQSFIIGGMVDGTLRMAATRYGPYEFWPGPLDEAGNPPVDCAPYDRLFKVSKADVEAYEATGTARPDLADWPTGLGAPTVDAVGNEIDLSGQPLAARQNRLIDLAAGERPSFLGDQMIWWVMNDMGNAHTSSGGGPVGVEVQGLAFAFDEPGAVGNATFYRYTITKKGASPLEDAYVSIFSDPDMGDFGDDWVGSDSTLGLGYVWNSDNFDGSGEGYGTPPPALGWDVFQGALVASPGSSARDGPTVVPGYKNVPVTTVLYYNNGGGVMEDPGVAEDYYNYMRGRWKDGKPVTEGGNGRDFSTIPTRFMFSGDAANCGYWTECNADGHGAKIAPGDRRFVVTTGPFGIAAGATQRILVGMVYARGEDNYHSVTAMKEADVALQRFVDSWFTEWPEAPEAPTSIPTLLSPADGAPGQPPRTTFVWDCPSQVVFCQVQVANDPDFASLVKSVAGASLTVDLTPDRTYWWRARVYGTGDVAGAWSAPFTLHVGNTVYPTSVLRDFQTVSNGAGPLDPPECGAFAFNGSLFPTSCPGGQPNNARQQVTAATAWGIHAGGAIIPFGPESDQSSYLGRGWGSRPATGSSTVLLPYDYEWRFTVEGGKAARLYDGGDLMDVPFEVWRTGIGTPDDPSDDVRLVPVVCEAACGAGTTAGRFDIGKDHAISGSANDPATDWVDWLLPDDQSPGQAGYEAYLAGTGGAREIAARQVLVCLNCGLAAPYPQEHPEIGTTFRILTALPPAPILAAPGEGAVVRSDSVRFWWNGPTSMAVDLELRTDPLAAPAATYPGVRSGSAIPVPGPGVYWWRVGSDIFGWSDAWRFEFAPTTAVETGGELPTSFALDAIWPNPFNPLATIRFGLPASASVTVDVVDVLGRRVAVLEAGGRRAAGWHSLQFDGSRLASGVYFVRLVAGGRLDVKSVVLLK